MRRLSLSRFRLANAPAALWPARLFNILRAGPICARMQLPNFFNVGSGMTFNIDEMSPVKVLVRTAED